ncbi:MAG: hypothetical protein MUF42_17380 [Cytophagaceae bacterium]|nr:hypothetical protein [Cytophagaceae bacterium]
METEEQERVQPRLKRMYYWYAQHDIKNSRGDFSGKLLHGPYAAYYPDKSLKSKGKFKKGTKKGKWKSWNKEGEFTWRMRFKKGNPRGKYFLYDAQGKLKKKELLTPSKNKSDAKNSLSN